MKKYRLQLLVFIVLTIYANLIAQINHVEPLNWWVGMKNPKLQLLIHGENIGETQPFIQYSGVTIEKTTKGDSKNYLFIDLMVAKNTKPGFFEISFKKNGKVVEKYSYELLPRQNNSSQLKGFSSKDVIYLIVPDRFVNGNEKNDVVPEMKENKIDRNFPGGRHGGDIRGIINSLDYIKDMGFTAIWPTPVLENNMPAYSYHGYAITNHYKVDSRFGTIEDYKELSQKAKSKGVKLIFDEVLNHTGSGYWWMNDLPFKDWLNYPNNYTGTNHKRTVNQDRYASNFDKDLWVNGWFDTSMPDMNGRNSFMANYLTQCSIWWIETLQLGGIRQDTYGYSDKEFLKNWSCELMNEYPNFNIVGEEWSTNPLIASYWQKGKINSDKYQSCLPSIMDFSIQSNLVDALKNFNSKDASSGLTKLYEALANDFNYADPNNILVFGDNHDMDRLFMQLNQDEELTKMALTYLLTIRGIPQLFYGTEILMDNTPNHKNDGLIRSDFPGGWKGDSVNAFTQKGLTSSQVKMQNYLKQLLNWRKGCSVFENGETLHFAPFEGMYVYFRFNKEKTVMMVMNRNENRKDFKLDRFKEIIGNKDYAKDIISNTSFSLKNNLSVDPKSVTIFEIN
jgi:neopullulanase